MFRTVSCASAGLLIGTMMGLAAGHGQTAIGDRQNGFSYQPTPEEIDSREKANGIRQSTKWQQTTDAKLAKLGQDLLQKEDLSTQAKPAKKSR